MSGGSPPTPQPAEGLRGPSAASALRLGHWGWNLGEFRGDGGRQAPSDQGEFQEGLEQVCGGWRLGGREWTGPRLDRKKKGLRGQRGRVVVGEFWTHMTEGRARADIGMEPEGIRLRSAR